MAEEIFTYADVWAAYESMEVAHKESVRVQVASVIAGGVTLAGMSEILFGAPVGFKEAAWKAWAANADVSGYHLKDILALGVTETAECVYPIVSRWAHTAKLSKCSVKDILKIGEALVNYDDFVAVWRNYAHVADFRKYKLMKIAELMNLTNDAEAAVIIASRWLEQADGRGVRELKALTVKDIEKINSYCLPQAAIDVWTAAKK